MRTLGFAILLASGLLALPAPAQASHITCDWDDVVCLATCIAVHDPCGWENPPRPLEREPCGSGERGADLTVFGEPLDACVGLRTEPCPPPFTGVVVYVEGQPHGVCVL